MYNLFRFSLCAPAFDPRHLARPHADLEGLASLHLIALRWFQRIIEAAGLLRDQFSPQLEKYLVSGCKRVRVARPTGIV